MVRKKSSNKSVIPATEPVAEPSTRNWLSVLGARHHNLKGIDVSFPLGALSVVSGVSGSGKSSLVDDILYKALARLLHRAQTTPGIHDSLRGVEHINKVIRVDQQPIGQTPTSNPATYTGVFELIRDLFSQLPDSKIRGYTARRFSFNVPGGRCEKCEGAGQLKIEMHFLPDVWITCDACNGKRYDRQTLEVKYRGRSIAEVLELSCGDALELFGNIPGIRRILRTLCDVGLDYVSLGQSATTLSGGEAQRVKLASELARPDTGRTLYLLDEPTTGLHFDDLKKLLDVLHNLVDLGNTVIVIEHNLDVMKNADWIVDLGPEAGAEGGYLVFQGTPEELLEKREKKTTPVGAGKKAAKNTKPTRNKAQNGRQAENVPLPSFHNTVSHTAAALRPVLEAGPYEERQRFDLEKLNAKQENDVEPEAIGAEARMPWEVDGSRWHTRDRVSRRGRPIRWDGRILKEIVQKIEASGVFAPTDWNNRTIVEIRAEKKSLGWFFHAITAEEWLLKMKFRTARNTFRKETLISQLDLKPLNEMEDIPIYGTEPRVRVQRASGPWQEIELRVHSLKEIDRPEFRKFLDLAIREFAKLTKKTAQKPDDLMPWKILGERWHFLPKGLVGGDRLFWDHSLLREVFDILLGIEPAPRPVWTNKVLVPVYRDEKTGHQSTQTPVDRTGRRKKRPWVVVHTKRVDAVYVDLYVPKNSLPLGRVRSIGVDPYVNGENEDYDIVQFKFAKKSDLKGPEFLNILRETAR